jgi:hypothetical protein
MAMTGAVMVGLLLAHSFVDYPLRTPALACLFALGCGLMVSPSGAPTTETPPRPARRRRALQTARSP